MHPCLKRLVLCCCSYQMNRHIDDIFHQFSVLFQT
jgi:hypothetical protein